MKKHFVKLGKDVIAYGVMGGISSLIGVILLPVFTRVFATDEYGILEIVVTFTTLTAIFIRLSLTQAIARYYFEQEDFKGRSRLVSTILMFLCISGVVLVCVGLIFSPWLAGILFDNREASNLIVLALVAAFFSAMSAVPSMVLRLQRKILKYNIVQGVQSILYAVVALYLVLETDMGVAGVVTASMIAAFMQFCLAASWIREYLSPTFSTQDLSRCLRFSLPLFPSVFVGWVNKQVDRIILLSYLGLSGVGLYGAGARIASIVLLGTMIFRQAWQTHAMSMLQEKEQERNRFFRHAFNYFVGMFAVIALGLVAVAPELFSLLVHADYQQAYIVVPWVAGAAIMQASIEFSAIGAVLREKTLAMSAAAWTGAALNILLGITLIPLFGINGAAIGGFTAAMVTNVILVVNTSRKTTVNLDGKVLISVLGIYIVGSIALVWFSDAYGQGLLPLLMRLTIFFCLSALLLVITVDKAAYKAIRSAIIGLLLPVKTTN